MLNDSRHQSQEARFIDGNLKLVVSAFPSGAEDGRWYALLLDLGESETKIQRGQRSAMGLQDLLPMAQEMLDDYVRGHNKKSKLLEWQQASG